MKRVLWLGLLAVGAVCATTCEVAQGAEKSAPVSGQAAFERLKTLAGEWHGKAGENQEVTVTYRVTAAGSAVMETLFPGSPHEMVTIYHLDGGRLVLTHYCAAGNQPRMVLSKKSSADELCFEFDGGANINPKKDGHMHSARFRFETEGGLACEWDYFKDGKKADTKKFALTRK